MRTLIFILLVCGSITCSQAQTITRVYGFWHANHVGNIPKLPPAEESGSGGGNQPAPAAERPNSYYLYIESSQSKAPAIEWVFVKGMSYKASVTKLLQLPAEYEYYDGITSKKITLVPKGRKNVFIVSLIKPNGHVAYQAGVSKDIVVGYYVGKKSKMATLKKMTNLPSSVVQ
jgi:hypothetical protein